MSIDRVCVCGHPYGAHWGYRYRNPCHMEKDCDCRDFEEATDER